MHSTATITKKESTPSTIFSWQFNDKWAHTRISKKNKWQEHEQAKSSIIHIIRAQQSVAYLNSKKMFE